MESTPDRYHISSYYGKGHKSLFISTIKDGSTDEILAYHISDRMTLELATDTLKKLKKNRNFKKAKDALIHSDQGIHYTQSYLSKS